MKHLESLLIANAKQVGRCTLLNGTAADYGSLPEADLADMAFFMEQIRTVLPVLGFDFLRDASKPVKSTPAGAVAAATESPVFVLDIPKHKIHARAQEVDGEFFVLTGSLARASWSPKSHTYRDLYEQLCEDGVLVPHSSSSLQFAADQVFSSPSAAAAVVSGRAANGRTQWKVEGTGQTYGEWQDVQVSTVKVASNPA